MAESGTAVGSSALVHPRSELRSRLAKRLRHAGVARWQDVMELRIAIVNYNTRDLLDRCLTSLFHHPPSVRFEVVVVDNGSTDGSVEMVREKHAWVKLFTARRNLGFAGGNNFAISDCSARYVLFLNSDIEVHPSSLDLLLEFMERHPEAGMCGSRLILPDGSTQASCAAELTLPKYITQQLLLDKLRVAKLLTGEYWVDCDAVTQPVEVEQLTGACMLCRREAVGDVGLMDEGYWMYCEDSDYCLRFRRRGWRLWYVPHATMRHELGGSSQNKRNRSRMIAAYNRAAARYFRLHQGFLAGLAGRFIGLLGVHLRLLLWTVAMVCTLGLWPTARQRAQLFLETLWMTYWPPPL